MSPLAIVLTVIFSLIFLSYVVFRLLALFNYRWQKVAVTNEVQINQNFVLLRDGETLDSYFDLNKKTNVLLIFFHGFGVHMHQFDWLKKYCQQRNFSLLLPSRRHSGKNISRKNAKYNLGIEAHDFYDIVKKARQMLPNHEIIVLGHSLAAGILAEFVGWKKTQAINAKFVLINTLTKFKVLNPANFLQNNWRARLRFLSAILFNSSQPLPLETWTNFLLLHCCNGCDDQRLKVVWQLVKKYEFQPETLAKALRPYKLCVRQLPLYYFANFWSIFFWTFRNLRKNRVNQIWVVQGQQDAYSNPKRVMKNDIKMQKKDNCRFLYIEDFGHGFFHGQTFEQNALIFDKIINAVLEKESE